MNENVKIEIRIIHPTEGEIVKRYDVETVLDDLKALSASASGKPDSGFSVASADLSKLSDSSWIQGAICAARCKNKAGFLACVARCMVDGKACDGGVNNCT